MQVYTPHLIYPIGDEVFNQGMVNISWELEEPLSDDEYAGEVTFEIEYTDNYIGPGTNWFTLKRRIPSTERSYDWNVGKMIKSKSVRLRIRARHSYEDTVSDYSMSSGDFAINVFDLIPPAIVNPIENRIYNDYILIILDESLTKNTYNQKVRYTLEYSSEQQNIDWTVIVANIPSGQNVIRWNTSELFPSDDYVLRLTAKNSSSITGGSVPSSPTPPASPSEEEGDSGGDVDSGNESVGGGPGLGIEGCVPFSEFPPDQIAKRYVYNIKIRPSGLFIIDTLPPEAVIRIENNATYTSDLEHVVNIFAEDQTTEVEKIQMRECFSDVYSALGLLSTSGPTGAGGSGPGGSGATGPTGPQGPTGAACPTVDDLLNGQNINFDFLINKPNSYSIKSQWKFRDESGYKKLEALLMDAGGNSSIQEKNKVFLPLFSAIDDKINDFILTQEQRERFVFEENNVVSEIASYQVAYLGTENGNYWRLDPFPTLINSSTISRSILKLYDWAGTRYLFTYINTTEYPDTGAVFRDVGNDLLLLLQLPNPDSQTTALSLYNNKLYFGLSNGELWVYDGNSFALVNTFSNSISDMTADSVYLYVAFETSSDIVLYNGSVFTTLTME